MLLEFAKQIVFIVFFHQFLDKLIVNFVFSNIRFQFY